MGQASTKESHQYGLDPHGYHNLVTSEDSKWSSPDGFQYDGTSLERPYEHDYPYTASARSQHKRIRRQQHAGKRKASSPTIRRGYVRRPSTSSDVSTASTARSANDSPPFASPLTTATTAEFAISVPKSVVVPVEEQALCYFLANWVLVPRQGRTGGYMEYIIPLYSSCKPNSHLHYALSAASLAAFANRPSCRQLSSTSTGVAAKASAMYAKALEHTNRALRDPLLVKDDETLASVLMLGTFESLTTSQSSTAWSSHNEGAVALIKLRGPESLNTRAGQILFGAVRSQTLVRCATMSSPYDKSVDWNAPSTLRDSGAYGSIQLTMLLIDLRNECDRILTAQSRFHDPLHGRKVLDLLARARDAKQHYLTWTETQMQSELWNFGPTAFVEKLPAGTNLLESEVFPGRVDVYHELWIGSVWSMSRTCGLLFSAIIVRCAAWLSPQIDFRTLPEYIEASRFDRKIVEDMIASVPFLLGWHKRQSRKDFLIHPDEQGRLPPWSLSGFACGDDGPVPTAEQGKALGGYFSMWPMFVAATSDFCTEAESHWLYGRLRFISDHMGIHQADLFAAAKIKLPSMFVYRDQMELANVPPPPVNDLEKAFIEGQGQSASGRVGVESNATTSPATCSTESPETMYRRPIPPVSAQ